MKELGLNTADYDWYLDLRRYGGVKRPATVWALSACDVCHQHPPTSATSPSPHLREASDAAHAAPLPQWFQRKQTAPAFPAGAFCVLISGSARSCFSRTAMRQRPSLL